jgi:hypothetical protein
VISDGSSLYFVPMTDKKLGVSEDIGKAGIVRPKHSPNVRGCLQEEGFSGFVIAVAVQVASERDGVDSVSYYCGSISCHH